MKAILTKFVCPTNTRGSRYSASDMDGNRVILGADYALDSEENHWRAAAALCAKMGWKGTLAAGATRDGFAFVFVDSRNIGVEPLAA